MIRRRAAPAVVAPLVALLAAACGGPGADPVPAPGRVITLAPSITETAFALGLGDSVVGVDDYSRWPPAARELPRLGGLLDPRLEAIVALEPELAVVLPSQRGLGQRLAALGIEVLEVPSDTLADVGRAAILMAERCGVAERGRRLAAEIERALAPAPLAGAPPTALVVGRQPGRMGSVLVAAPGTYLDELLGRLGAANVFADAATPYPQVGLEAFLERRPRAVVELHGEPQAADVERRLRHDWLTAPGLELSEPCVAVVDGLEVLVPGPRLPEVYARLRSALVACAGEGAPVDD